MELQSYQQGSEPRCFLHPQLGAVARCVSCKRNVCSSCRVSLENRNYCRECASRAYYAPPPDAYSQQHTPPPDAYSQHYAPASDVYARQYAPASDATALRFAGAGQRSALPFPEATWSVFEPILIFLIALFVSLGAGFILAFVIREMYSGVTGIVILLFSSSVLLNSVMLGGTYISVKISHGGSRSAVGLKLDGAGKGLLLGVGLGIPLFFAAICLSLVINILFKPAGNDVVSKSLETISSGSPANSLWLILVLALTLVVIAPVCEEIFFRGYLYPALRNRTSMQSAMLINGALFAAAHLEIIGFLPRFLLGYGLCYMYDKSRTIIGPITGHALYNGLILVIALIGIL